MKLLSLSVVRDVRRSQEARCADAFARGAPSYKKAAADLRRVTHAESRTKERAALAAMGVRKGSPSL